MSARRRPRARHDCEMGAPAGYGHAWPAAAQRGAADGVVRLTVRRVRSGARPTGQACGPPTGGGSSCPTSTMTREPRRPVGRRRPGAVRRRGQPRGGAAGRAARRRSRIRRLVRGRLLRGRWTARRGAQRIPRRPQGGVDPGDPPALPRGARRERRCARRAGQRQPLLYPDMSQIASVRLSAEENEVARRLALSEALYDAAPVGMGFVDDRGRFQRLSDTLAGFSGVGGGGVHRTDAVRGAGRARSAPVTRCCSPPTV